jgi:hypothetical protein
MKIDSSTQIPVTTAELSSGNQSDNTDRLEIGDVIKVRVTHVDGDVMTLRTADGGMLTATRGNAGHVMPGDHLQLQVLQKNDGHLTVEVLSTEKAGAVQTLRAQGLPVTAENIELAQAIIRSGETPTAEKINDLASVMMRFPRLPLTTAAFMQSQSIPINHDTIRQVSNLLVQKDRIDENLTKLLDILGKSADIPLPKGAVPSPPASGPAYTQTPVTPTVAVTPDSTAAAPVPAAQTAVPEPAPNQGLPQPTAIPVNHGAAPSTSAQVPVPPQLPEQILQADSPAVTQQPAAQPFHVPSPQTPAAAPEPPAHIPAGTASTNDAVPEQPVKPETLSPVEPQPVTRGIPAVPVAQTQAAPAQQGQLQPELPARQAEPGLVAPEPMSPPLPNQPPTIRMLAENLFRRIDTQDDNPGREITAAAFNRKLDAILQQSQQLELSPAVRQSLNGLIREMQSEARTLTQMDHFSAYLQMPIIINDKKTNAELYVFKDSRGRNKIDPKNATVFLSLSTVQVGRVDCFVKVIGTNVECDFKLDDDGIAAHFRRHYTHLSKLLHDSGYSLSHAAFRLKKDGEDITSIKPERDQWERKFSFDRSV